jgi:ABC-2 type transport system permease protein
MYGAHTLQAVIEEKSNRVVEVLLSSMSPGSLMLGKVLGIGAAGLTQTAIWTAAFFVVSQQGVSIGSFKLDTSFLTPIIWISFLMYFLLGFFLYALLYAGVGAMCNTIQDSQQFNFPLMMGLVLPMLLLSLVVEAPDSPLSIGLSLFPLFAPVLMFMRVCLQTPPAWQIGLSWLLLLLSIWLAARAAGKLFRLGVLMYGASPTWATLVRALRQP